MHFFSFSFLNGHQRKSRLTQCLRQENTSTFFVLFYKLPVAYVNADFYEFSFSMQRDPGSNPDLISSFEIKQAKLQQNLTACDQPTFSLYGKNVTF